MQVSFFFQCFRGLELRKQQDHTGIFIFFESRDFEETHQNSLPFKEK